LIKQTVRDLYHGVIIIIGKVRPNHREAKKQRRIKRMLGRIGQQGLIGQLKERIQG
jgi:hypothetical protein